MMDESASPVPSMISLSSDSDEIQRTTPGDGKAVDLIGTGMDEYPDRDPEDEANFPFTPRPREPLRKSSTENEPVEIENENHPENMENYFRPSPMDVSPPKLFEPGQDFYTTTIKQPESEGTGGGFVMPQFPGQKNRKKLNPGYGQGMPSFEKQDRILSNPNLNIQQQSVLPIHKLQQNVLPIQKLQQFGPNSQRILNGGNFGQNHHPFAHYTVRDQMYSPSHYHHNKYHYLNPTIEKEQLEESQSPADDKYDSPWTSTFVLLGGLVAASALVAFILPSFLTTMTTSGKDNDESGSESSDIWSDIKGLYTDLTHIARGDFSHFNKEINSKNENDVNEEETKSSTSRVSIDHQQDPDQEEIPENENQEQSEEHEPEMELIVASSSRGRGRGRHNETLASPVHPSISMVRNATFLTPPPILHANKYSRTNNTFLKEWAKVQLQLIDN